MGRWLRILRLVAFAGSLCCISNTIQAANTTTKDGGRYQLLAAKISVIGPSATTEMNLLFKIDTTTGQTWIFTIGAKDGTLIEGWRPLR